MMNRLWNKVLAVFSLFSLGYSLSVGTDSLLAAALEPVREVTDSEVEKYPSESGHSLTGFDYLRPGQRIKVEGKNFQDGSLIAEEIEVAEADDEFELEGIASSLDNHKHRFKIGGFEIRLYESTEIESSKREPRSISDLREGLRVKVKADTLVEGVVEAKSVRIYEESTDRDFELEGNIERLNREDSTLILVSTEVLVTSKTRYANIPAVGGLGDSLDPVANRGIRRDDDEPDFAAFRMGPAFFGGRAGFAYEGTRNYDLNQNREDSDNWLIPSARLEVSLPFGEHHEVYTKVGFNQGWNLGDNPRQSTRGSLDLKEAFLYLGRVFSPSLGLQIGRQRFRDKREWIYDDQLDAVRLHFRRSGLKLEASAARAIFRPTGSRSDQFYLMGWGEQRLPGRRYLAGYLIKRNDLTGRDEDPIWFGLQSRGRITRNLSYWAELSRMVGRKRNRLLRGYGYDVGGSYRFSLPLEPTISVGYAFGSGDQDPKDDIDGNFRQTRLNDNSDRLNGLKRYRYYGVLLDPELSNLKVTTLDLGLRPSENWSVNVVYHGYRQTVPSRDLGDTEIAARPNGRDPQLGHELNFILALRRLEKIDISLYGGMFLPGPAFSGERPRALLFRPVILFYF